MDSVILDTTDVSGATELDITQSSVPQVLQVTFSDQNGADVVMDEDFLVQVTISDAGE